LRTYTMDAKMDKPLSDKSAGSETTLHVLDSLLQDSGQKKINESQLMIILDALATSDDAAMVARFPAVLAICARRGLGLNSQALFSRYWETSPKRQNLEKLMLVSSTLFALEGLTPPKNLDKIAASLSPKYGDFLASGEFQLSNGMCISVRNLQTTLKNFTANHFTPSRIQSRAVPVTSGNLNMLLDRLFSPKQKELVFKKLDGKMFTKTEREYYSRTVRKKLEAIANDDVAMLAKKLMSK